MNAEDPNLERWGLFLGLVYGLGLSLRKLLKGGSHLYLANYGDEKYWDPVCWKWVAAGMLVCLLAGLLWFCAPTSRRFRRRPLPATRGDLLAGVDRGERRRPGRHRAGRRPARAVGRFSVQSVLPRLVRATGALTYHFQFVSSQDDRDTTE